MMSRALQTVTVAYAVAAAMAVAVAYAVSFDHPIAIALAADVAATCTIFAFSFAFRNSSFYDAYWSVVPPVIGAYWWFASDDAGVDGMRRFVVLSLVTIWAVRLTYNWVRGWEGLDHEDWRYVNFQKSSGNAYWGVSFAGIHMAPTLWVFLGCLPLYPALALGTRPFGTLDGIAAVFTAAMIYLEARADKELVNFKKSGNTSGRTLTSGLRRYSRHPNYLGEMGFWWGLFLFGLAAHPSWWWTVVGAGSITLLFRFASLPMIEERMSSSRADYADYAARTSLVLPWPPQSNDSPRAGEKGGPATP
jgi:steroid 5-alpha reductase family enzyme